MKTQSVLLLGLCLTLVLWPCVSAAEDASSSAASADGEIVPIPIAYVEPEEPLISLRFINKPLLDVVRFFIKKCDLDVVVNSERIEGQRVVVHLRDVEWKPALRAILNECGLSLIERIPDSEVYTIMKTPPDACEPPITEILSLQHLDATNMVGVFQPLFAGASEFRLAGLPSRNVLLVRGYTWTWQNIKRLLGQLDRPAGTRPPDDAETSHREPWAKLPDEEQREAPSPEPVTVRFIDAPLLEVVGFFIKKLRLQVVANAEHLEGRRVTANLQEAPWPAALDAILRECGLYLSEWAPADAYSIRKIPPQAPQPTLIELFWLRHLELSDAVTAVRDVVLSNPEHRVVSIPSHRALIVLADFSHLADVRGLLRQLDRPAGDASRLAARTHVQARRDEPLDRKEVGGGETLDDEGRAYVEKSLADLKAQLRQMTPEELLKNIDVQEWTHAYAGKPREYFLNLFKNRLIEKELEARGAAAETVLRKHQDDDRPVFTGEAGPFETIGTLCRRLLKKLKAE